MFEKLLAVIPYSPGLIGQMAFYSRRMREEASIRRIGTVFLFLAFLLQSFAVLSPPQTTLAGSDNDLITGGFSTRREAERACLHNVKYFGDIIHTYGLSCKDIGLAESTSIHSNAEHGQYYSLGWQRQGARNDLTGEPTNETPANIYNDNGRLVAKVYWRKLNSWDSYGGNGKEYQALKMRNNDGKLFYILNVCGNLVTIGLPTPTHRTTGEATPVPETPQPAPETPQPAAPTETPPPATTPPPPVCEYNPGLPADSTDCKPCDKSVSSQDTLACIIFHKKADNVTLAVHTDANNTTVKAGDVITYTLSVQNAGKADVKNFVFLESLSDVLDYADVADLHGGTMDSSHTVSWPAETVKAGQTAEHKITVKVKDPVPATPRDPANPNHFDLIMANIYGDTVKINVTPPPTKQVEVAATKLPNTGPGTSLMLAGAIVIMAGYFYSRAGLLARESELAVKEASQA